MHYRARDRQANCQKGEAVELPEVVPLPIREPDKDGLLTLLVAVANDTGIDLDITVVAEGTVVSGRLVSMHDWLKMNADKFPDGEVAQTLANHLRQLAAEVTPASEGSDDDSGETTASYVHLADARFVGTQGTFPEHGTLLWRGRLARISGWSFGSLRTVEAP